MPTVLYIGDGYATVKSAAESGNRKRSGTNWTIEQVPLGPFPRATRDGLTDWFRGNIKGYQPRKGGYDAVVVACDWSDLVQVIKEQLPNAPIVHLGHPDEAPAGIAAAVGHLELTELLPTIERLLQQKQQ